MERAIAGRGRVCQAAVLVVVLVFLGEAARAQDTPSQPENDFEARTPDGVVVREICRSGQAAAAGVSPCGSRAKQVVDIINRLIPLLGPFPQKVLVLDYATSKAVVPRRYVASGPGRIAAAPEMMKFAGGNLYVPALLPREVARQWLLPRQPNERLADPWLAEGFPEYVAWRYLLEAQPETARALVAEAMRDSVAGSRQMPALGAAGTAHAESEAQIASVRQRGLLVLRTLETVIDRERVDRALPEFLRRYRGGAFTISNFEKVCEEVAGRDLAWFFRYYIGGMGIPEIELRRVPSESPGVAAGEILVKGLPPEGSVRVEMAVRTAQGVVEHSVATRGAVTPFTVNVPAPALGIALDPGLRILRWTEAARRSKAQSEILAALPDPITAKTLPAAVELYRRALAADPDDVSLRAQALHERLGELEWAHDEWNAALADLEAAINGHSISPYETYLCRAKAYLYHGVVQLHERQPREAQKDARAGLALPRVVLLQEVPREPIESRGDWTLQQLLEILSDAASRY